MSDPSAEMPNPIHRSTKSQRVLACVLCQQRKVKCDRKFPCGNCIKSKAQCVPATLTPRRRKRRFPERELLDRLHRYESLLRQNNITFESPLLEIGQDHEDTTQDRTEHSEEDGPSTAEGHSPKSKVTSRLKREYKARNFWHAVSLGLRDDDHESDTSNDDIRERTVKRVWKKSHDNGYHLLFGTRGLYVDLSMSHPDPIQIFRLWQNYLDNVNPLLKVTHTPTLQGRIIEASSDLNKITPTLEALLFGIYCISILSMSEDACQSMLGFSKEDSLIKYQIACQQALANCGFLQTDERDCLTALFLYLITVRHNTIPPIVSSLFGVALRLAQQMGIHSEHALTKCSIFEAEMRRRLWWALVLFDSRMGELANSKPVTLDPTWDCKKPLNVSDTDLRPEMKSVPSATQAPTEAIFAVLRSEVGEFVRHAEFHLEFNSPGLKPLARTSTENAGQESTTAENLERLLQERYFQFCDEDNSLHFMTIWFTRSALAKCRLLEHHARYSNPSVRQTEALRGNATLHAIRLLESDTKIMTSPLVECFTWFNHFHFPFPAYIQVIQDLKKRPNNDNSKKAWEAMSANLEPWIGRAFGMDTPFFDMFTKMVLEAWEACETANEPTCQQVAVPKIVTLIREILTQSTSVAHESNTGQTNVDTNMSMEDLQTSGMAIDANQNLPFGAVMQPNWPMMRPELFSSPSGQPPMNPYTRWPGFEGHHAWSEF